MSETRSEALLVRAEPLELARQVCQRLVAEVQEADGELVLAADHAWAGAINTVLIKKGVRVSELHRIREPRRTLQS